MCMRINNILYQINILYVGTYTDSRSQMEIRICKMRLIRIIIIYVKIMRRPYITPLQQQRSRIRNVSKYKSPNHPLYYSSTLYFFFLLL